MESNTLFVARFCSFQIQARRLSEISPVAKLKAIKNDVEIEGMKNAHVSKQDSRAEPHLRWNLLYIYLIIFEFIYSYTWFFMQLSFRSAMPQLCASTFAGLKRKYVLYSQSWFQENKVLFQIQALWVNKPAISPCMELLVGLSKALLFSRAEWIGNNLSHKNHYNSTQNNAVSIFYLMFFHAIQVPKGTLTEMSGANKLEELRRCDKYLKMLKHRKRFNETMQMVFLFPFIANWTILLALVLQQYQLRVHTEQ